jgi:autotransporter-associated beta strand protein
MSPIRRLALALVTPLVVTLTVTAPAAAQGIFTWNTSGDNAWLTAGNWNGPSATFPGTTNNVGIANNNAGDTATFASALPSGNIAGIDMGGGGAAGLLQLGAITFSNTTGSLAIGNSSPLSAGTLRLNGADVNGQLETILSNTSGSQTLTIQNSVGAGTQPLTVLLGSLPTGGVGYVVAGNGSTIAISANITDGGTPKGITIPGGGTVILSGANIYSGTTLVTGGTLQVANTSGSATGSGMVGVASPGRLSGTGTIDTALGVDVGGRLQPGTDAAAGTLTVNGGASISGASSHYIWSLSNAGTAFTSAPTDGASDASGQSRLTVNGNLNFQPGTIDVTGLGATGFDNTKFYSWTVATGSPASISTTQPTFNTTGLVTGGGSFFLSSNGTSVFVSFSPVPEPASILVCCVAAAGLTGYVRRRATRSAIA